MDAQQPRRQGDRGSAAVEFALVLPVLVLLVFAIVDFGRMLTTKIAVTEAAREGARAAALVGVDQGVRRVYDVTGELAEVTPEVSGCDGPSTDATVIVTYRFTFITPVGLIVGDDHIDLVSRSVMPCLG